MRFNFFLEIFSFQLIIEFGKNINLRNILALNVLGMSMEVFRHGILNIMEWGWKEENKSIVPRKTDLDPAPDWLLNVIRCKCKDGTRNQCGTMSSSCRKNGLKCVTDCGDCRGETCNMSS